MLSAVFLDGCITVHDYKNKMAALGGGAANMLREYQIAECYTLKYDDYIYLCNHLNEQRSIFKQTKAEKGVFHIALFYCNRADKVLLVHTKKNGLADSIAVLYNAGQRVEDRSSSHRARDLRTAIERQRKANLKQFSEVVKTL